MVKYANFYDFLKSTLLYWKSGSRQIVDQNVVGHIYDSLCVLAFGHNMKVVDNGLRFRLMLILCDLVKFSICYDLLKLSLFTGSLRVDSLLTKISGVVAMACSVC